MCLAARFHPAAENCWKCGCMYICDHLYMCSKLQYQEYNNLSTGWWSEERHLKRMPTKVGFWTSSKFPMFVEFRAPHIHLFVITFVRNPTTWISLIWFCMDILSHPWAFLPITPNQVQYGQRYSANGSPKLDDYENLGFDFWTPNKNPWEFSVVYVVAWNLKCWDPWWFLEKVIFVGNCL